MSVQARLTWLEETATAVRFVGGAGGGSVVAEATFEGGESLAPSVAMTR